MPSIDPEYAKKHYAANKPRYMENQKRRRRDKKEWIDDLKKNFACKYCPENCYHCLDFHHARGKKSGDISSIGRWWSIERLLEELEKCDVVCANCHRKLHAGIKLEEYRQADALVH